MAGSPSPTSGINGPVSPSRQPWVNPKPISGRKARPDLNPGAVATAEVVGAYAHRADVPQELWVSLLTGATKQIDIVGYAYPFVLELLPDAVTRIVDKCRSGARVRLAFADPACAHVMERDSLEQMGGTLPGRIRNALNFLDPLIGNPGCEIGLHTVHLYNAVFRFDSQMIVTPYLYRARDTSTPLCTCESCRPTAFSPRSLTSSSRSGRPSSRSMGRSIDERPT